MFTISGKKDGSHEEGIDATSELAKAEANISNVDILASLSLLVKLSKEAI
jgi:hypothetical protein